MLSDRALNKSMIVFLFSHDKPGWPRTLEHRENRENQIREKSGNLIAKNVNIPCDPSSEIPH